MVTLVHVIMPGIVDESKCVLLTVVVFMNPISFIFQYDKC